MEFFIKILIYIHIFFGGLGLFSGVASLYFRKGRTKHRNAGHIFTVCMIISASLSLIISVLPNHQNTFLFLIGLFTIYLILAGNRVLTFKDSQKSKADILDKVISGSMFVVSLIMFLTGIINWIKDFHDAMLYLFFGAIGLYLTVSDFNNFNKFKKEKFAYLKSHITRMTGALIASFTAFLVTGLHHDQSLFWIAPSIIGTIVIMYWTKKVGKKKFYKRTF